MDEKPKRRWFRFAFSLRTLFILVTLVGVWLGWNIHLVRQRQAALKYLSSASLVIAATDAEPVHPWRRLPVLWGWLGARPIRTIEVFKTHQSDRDIEELERLFPETSIIVH